MLNSASARAHTNIALAKYWGKRDEELIIPMNSSLSLTLDHFYTDTQVTFDDSLTADFFELDNRILPATKLTPFLDLVRQKAGIKTFAAVKSFNHVPNQAGLASSASAYAALAAAASKAAGLELTRPELSRLARRGSGSASRSIYGGFVEWQEGHDDLTSVAVPIEEETDWKIGMLAIILNAGVKKIASRAGMQHVVKTSPYYPAWVKESQADIDALKQAIANRDFTRLGEISESNALRMHALNLAARPPFSYFEASTIRAITMIEELRAQGVSCYYTMDAGPNVKVLCQEEDLPTIKAYLAPAFGTENLLFARPGQGVRFLEGDLHG